MAADNTSLEGGQFPWSAEYNPWTLQEAVSREKSIPALRGCLGMTRDHAPEEYEQMCRDVFSDLVNLKLLPLITHVLDRGEMPVNGIDSGVSHDPMNTHFGTPIAYAAGCPPGAAVVAWLLGKGADPHRAPRG
ncbi:hypothetical protein PG996_011698 [Apiospora saccharicola]|uniref:Ankyrin repeat domain-containing protein n=1 Tax=Apiospora saccharicola TaxID=335842 RepID=A0ABR1UFS0_9PEZI